MLLHHVTLRGGAPHLVALHGGLGWDHHALRPWLDPLADDATLTYADLRGCGRSVAPEGAPEGAPGEPLEGAAGEAAVSVDALTHADWADDVEVLRRHLDEARGDAGRAGAGRIVLFGHSYGAIIALEVARRHPAQVAGLILCTPVTWGGYLPGAVDRALGRAEGDVRAAALEAFAGPPASDEAFAALLPRLLPLYVHEPAAHDLADYAARMTLRAAPARRSFYDLVADYDVRGELGDVAVPTLVLAGRHDWVAPPEESPADLARGLPEAELHVFEASGHLPFLEEPAAFLGVVRRWLRAHAPALT